jgi:hypothetical protein
VYAAYHEIAEGDHIDPMADSHVAVVPIHAGRRLHPGPVLDRSLVYNGR